MTTTVPEQTTSAPPEPEPSPGAVHARYGTTFADGSELVHAADIPWTPWGMPGTSFKLLHLDDDTGLMVFLLRVEPGTVAALHKHFGAAHAFTLSGWWGYADRYVRAGEYLKEAGGVSHMPLVGPEGTTMLAFGFGPIAGIGEDGSVLGVIDNDWMHEAARANGAADHIVRRGAAASG